MEGCVQAYMVNIHTGHPDVSGGVTSLNCGCLKSAKRRDSEVASLLIHSPKTSQHYEKW